MDKEVKIKAIAHVKITKKDASGNVVEIKEYDSALSEKEALGIWQSQQQE